MDSTFSFPKTKNHNAEAVINTFVSGWDEQCCAAKGQIWLFPRSQLLLSRGLMLSQRPPWSSELAPDVMSSGPGYIYILEVRAEKSRMQFGCQDLLWGTENHLEFVMLGESNTYRSHRGTKIVICYDIAWFCETCIISQWRGCHTMEIAWNLGILNQLSRCSPYSMDHGNLTSSASDAPFKRGADLPYMSIDYGKSKN